jgi:type IV pilus assembly protein PilV
MTRRLPLEVEVARQGGFALLEVLVAVLIFSIGILALVGMQATATRYATDAQFRSMASYLANQRMADIWVGDRAHMADFKETDVSVASLPNGKRTVDVVADATNGYQVAVTIKWMIPGDATEHQHVAVTYVHDRCDNAGC